MEIRMDILEKFELSGGVRVLVCAGCDSMFDVVGEKFSLMYRENIRQILTLSGEREILNQKSHFDKRAFETNDIVSLSPEEVKSGDWHLISV